MEKYQNLFQTKPRMIHTIPNQNFFGSDLGCSSVDCIPNTAHPMKHAMEVWVILSSKKLLLKMKWIQNRWYKEVDNISNSHLII